VDWQHKERQQHKANMNGNLGLVPQPFRSGIRVKIASQKRRLKKNNTGIPYGRGASEQRKSHLRYHRFHQEQKRCAEEHRDREGDQQQKASHCNITGLSRISKSNTREEAKQHKIGAVEGTLM
jgi:hypothetical protein